MKGRKKIMETKKGKKERREEGVREEIKAGAVSMCEVKEELNTNKKGKEGKERKREKRKEGGRKGGKKEMNTNKEGKKD